MRCSFPLTYDSTIWAKETTPAQASCNQYLKQIQDNYKGKKALHMGVGTSSLYLNFHSIFRQIDGVTVIDEEVVVAQEAQRLCRRDYRVFQFNKYNIRNLNVLDSNYDLIDDISLKHYGCCEEHWREYFDAITQRLVPGGILTSHEMGFHKHSGLSALSMEELKIVCRENPRHIRISVIKLLPNELGLCPLVLTIC